MNTAVLSRLEREVWAVLPSAFAELYRAAATPNAATSIKAPERAKPQRNGDTMTVPVVGILTRRPSALEKLFGFSDVEEISANIAAAASDPSVKRIVLDVDSPGGSVAGIPELAALFATLKKPTVARTSGLMASAAYWIAAGADRIEASPSAEVGSVGVFSAHYDMSGALARAGISVDLFKSSPLKGIGVTGTSLDDKQRAYLQAKVEHLHGLFEDHIRAHRHAIADEAFSGATFLGSQAAPLGLVDTVSGVTPSAVAAGMTPTLRGQMAVASGRAAISAGGGHRSVSWEEAKQAAAELKN